MNAHLFFNLLQHVTAPAPRFLMRAALIAEMLGRLDYPVRRMVEIGPGLGDLASWLHNQWPETALDLYEISPESAYCLKTRFSSSEVAVRQCDFFLEPPAKRYDLIVACEVLEHIEKDAEAVQILADRLEHNGTLVISVPAFMRNWQAVDVYAGHVRRYERRDLLEKMHAAALEPILFWSYGFPVTNLLYPLRQAYYAWHNRCGPISPDVATRRSGYDRRLVKCFGKNAVALGIRPMLFIQKLALQRDLGDGFLVQARKRLPHE